MNVNAVREFAQYKALLQEKEAEVKALKEKLAELEPELINQFADDEVQSIKVEAGNGNQTVYVQRQLWARNLKSATDTAKAFKEAGLGHMLVTTVPSQTVSSYLRDLEEAGTEMPASFEGVVEPFEKFSVRVRKS